MSGITTWGLVVGAIAVVGLIIYVFYINNKSKQSKGHVFRFLLFMQDKYNEVLWKELAEKGSIKNLDAEIARKINYELRKKTEKEFQYLMQTLYCFSDDYSSFYYEPHTHNFIKEICPIIRATFLGYKKNKRPLDKITAGFFEETYEVIKKGMLA